MHHSLAKGNISTLCDNYGQSTPIQYKIYSVSLYRLYIAFFVETIHMWHLLHVWWNVHWWPVPSASIYRPHVLTSSNKGETAVSCPFVRDG